MAGRDSGWYRKTYEDISGELTVLAATDDTTLVTVKNSKYTIFIQEIHFFVTTDAAQSMSFEDSAGTPFVLRDIPASPGDSSEWHFYMSDEGHPLTEGKDFKMMVSAAGLAGALKWVGYQKLSSGRTVNNHNLMEGQMDRTQLEQDLIAARERLDLLKAEIYRQDGIVGYLQNLLLSDSAPPANQTEDSTATD